MVNGVHGVTMVFVVQLVEVVNKTELDDVITQLQVMVEIAV